MIRNLECPKPIVETKKALQNLQNNEILEIVLNSVISKNNVLKFLTSLNLHADIEENNNEFYIRVKNKNLIFPRLVQMNTMFYF